MDYKTFYRQGVLAIRDENDPERGRMLLLKSLELEPANDMAWLWLTRTAVDSAQQLEYVERALAANPDNEAALKLQARLARQLAPGAAIAPAPITPALKRLSPHKTVDEPVTEQERKRILAHMEHAAIRMEAGEVEQAIAHWVKVLEIRVDHETALRNAAGHLWRLNYRDDAVELVQRALDAGTSVPSLYLTAIDMAERQGRYAEAAALRNRIASLPDADPQLLVTIANGYIEHYHVTEALEFLQRALEVQPEEQALLLRLGDLYRDNNQHQEAMKCYDRAVRLGVRSDAGKEADRRLATFVPVLTDTERGSLLLALRETLGIGAIYFLLGWQDAGIDVLALGPRRWFGVLLSLIGGHLLVTATSSPQHRPLARLLGGELPPGPSKPVDLLQEQVVHTAPGRALEEPTYLPRIGEEMRYALGIAGAILLVLAFVLVFRHAIDLVTDTTPPFWLW